MDHMQFLMSRSKTSEEAEISGHALMATCPPQSYVDAHPEEKSGYPHKMPDLGMPDLMKLLDLSQRLPLDGEITPIMAWALVRGDERFGELGVQDFEGLKEDLKAKVRCYGYVSRFLTLAMGEKANERRFGAVLEEFEVKDALERVLMKKEGGRFYSPPAGGEGMVAEY